MTSAKKHAANRANARASTGPKAPRGKAHSSQNAHRHGLSLSVLSDPLLLKEVEPLAKQLFGEPTTAQIHQLAREIAVAQIELRRVRWARHQLLFEALKNPDWDSEVNHRAKIKAVVGCAQTDGPFKPMPDDVVEFIYSKPTGANKFIMILSDTLHQLFVLDRYERRVLSKRKFAICAVDDAGRRLLANATARSRL